MGSGVGNGTRTLHGKVSRKEPLEHRKNLIFRSSRVDKLAEARFKNNGWTEIGADIQPPKDGPHDDATAERVLEFQRRPPFGRSDIGGNDHITRVELDLATVNGNAVGAGVDELVKLRGLHPIALELVNDDDVALVVTVPILAGSFGGRKRKHLTGGVVVG